MRSDRDRGVHRGVARHRRRRFGLHLLHGRADDRGSATVEFAAALPVVVAFLLIGLATLNAFAARVRLVDMAGTAARAAARGEPDPTGGHGTAAGDVTISVFRDGDTVRVVARRQLRLGPLPAITFEEQAVALVEPESAAP